MQPIGQPAQPKQGINMPGGMPQGGAPQPGRPQAMPAGAAQAATLLPGGITNSIQDIKDAYSSNPQRLQQASQQGDILSAIALQQILTEQQAKKRDMELKQAQQTGQSPLTVVEQKQREAVELRRQDLEEQQAKRLGHEQQQSQQAMAQFARNAARPQPQQQTGIASLPAPNAAEPRAMATGGIIAFEEGGPTPIEDEAGDRPIGAPVSQRRPTRAEIENLAWQRANINRADKEELARKQYARVADYTPEEKEAQNKRIAAMEEYDREAYDPERLKREELKAFLLGAANTGGIGETLGRAGGAGLNYSNKMREISRQRMEDRNKKSEDWLEAQRGVRVKGLDFGQKAGAESERTAEAGLTALSHMSNTDVQAAQQAAARGNPEDKKLLTVLARINNDDRISGLLKEIEKNRIQPGTPQYEWYQTQIGNIRKAYFEEAGIKQPPVQLDYNTYPKDEEKKDSGWNFMEWIGGGDKKSPPPPPAGFVAQ